MAEFVEGIKSLCEHPYFIDRWLADEIIMIHFKKIGILSLGSKLVYKRMLECSQCNYTTTVGRDIHIKIYDYCQNW